MFLSFSHLSVILRASIWKVVWRKKAQRWRGTLSTRADKGIYEVLFFLGFRFSPSVNKGSRWRGGTEGTSVELNGEKGLHTGPC